MKIFGKTYYDHHYLPTRLKIFFSALALVLSPFVTIYVLAFLIGELISKIFQGHWYNWK